MKWRPHGYAPSFLLVLLTTYLPVVQNEGNILASSGDAQSTKRDFSGGGSFSNFSNGESRNINLDSKQPDWLKIKKLEIECLRFALHRANESHQLEDSLSVSSEEEWLEGKFNVEDCKHLSLNGALLEINDSWSGAAKAKLIHHIKLQLLCNEEAVNEYSDDTLRNFCPRVWDKILCWPPTPPDTESSIPCTPHNNATRFCEKNGKWFNSTDKDPTGYTNYHACFAESFPLERWLLTVKKISITGYSISLITLVLSFAILISLRKLRCPRNILHLHLFASFILRALVILLKASFQDQFDSASTGQLSGGQSLSTDAVGTWWCKLAIVLWQYFIVANYSWILMEGLYLHNLIFMALFSDSSAITLYIFLGWGIPSFFVVLWAVLRATLDEMGCWTVHKQSWIFWICIRFPVAFSNLINFFFFLNVTRVLFSKFRSAVNPESMKYRKLARSTLVLVPLFGVPYFLLWGLSTSSNATVELVWLFLDQSFASFQGFFVAVLYCLLNGEVRQEVMRQYYRFKGDTFTNASHSTMMSHTKTFLSRGRTSISIHSADREHKNGAQTPSPKKQCSFGDHDGSTYYYHDDPSPVKSRSPELADLVHYESNSTPLVMDTIEMIPCRPTVPVSTNLLLQPSRSSASSEEVVPLLFFDEATNNQGKVKVNSQLTKSEWDRQIPMESNLSSCLDKDSEINKTSESLILLSSGVDTSGPVEPPNNKIINTSVAPNQVSAKQKDFYVILNPASQVTQVSVTPGDSTTASQCANQESKL